jgi:hypothetical protein
MLNFSVKVEYKLTYNGTEQKINVIFSSDPTGISNPGKLRDLILYSTGGNVSVKYHFENTANRQLQVYNIIGQKITEINLSEATGTKTLSTLYKGVYLYSLSENGKVVKSGKFIINKI